MECKNCIHCEVCKYIDDFKSSKECIDRTLFNDKPIIIESKCTMYKLKEANQCGSYIPDYNNWIKKLHEIQYIPFCSSTLTTK